MERSRKAIGLAHFRIDDLRCTAATGMAELGASSHTIGMVLSHISVRHGTVTSGVFIQYTYDKEKREGLELWGRRLEEIITPGRVSDLDKLPAHMQSVAGTEIEQR